MSWGVIFPAAFLAACLLAGPATAGIRRYKDSQGIIRITNIAPAKPRQVEPPSKTAAHQVPETAQEVPQQPQTGPPAATPALPPSGEVVKTALAPAKAPPAASPEPQPGPIHPQTPENQSIARPPADVNTPESLPLRKVAFGQDDAAASPSPGARAASSHLIKYGAEGEIRHFRNRQGVLVITNVKPAAPKPAPPGRQTVRSAAADSPVPVERPDRTPAFSRAAAFKPASWNPDQPPSWPAAIAAAGLDSPRAPGAIRHYRDKHGVIHIENVGNATAEAPKPPVTLARAEPPEATEPAAFEPVPPEKEEGPPFIDPPAPVPLKEEAPVQILTAAASPQDEIPIHDGIRRYRDRLGIWHIETVDRNWLLETRPLPPPAANPRQVILAAAQEAASLPFLRPAVQVSKAPGVTRIPGPSFAPVLPRYASLAYPRNEHGISVTRDRQGRLVITNAPVKTRSRGGRSWKLASAQLDPIIQDAARAYRLPPNLIRAVIRAESNFVTAAVSPKGAMGLMQLMPGTADFLGVEEPFNPWQNIHGGCRYLRLLIDSFGGSVPLALAGYNAGPQRVVACGYRVPDIKETKNFLTKVLEWYFTAEQKAGRPCT